MKKYLSLGATIVAALVMTGCASVNTSDGAYAGQIEVKKTYQADVAVQETAVSGEATVNCLFGFISWGVNKYADDAFVTSNSGLCFASPATVAKQGATYNACTNAKADCLLAAKYSIDTKDYFVFKTVKCKATGFPATIKGVK